MKKLLKEYNFNSDMQYIRTSKKGAGKSDIYIYNHNWSIKGAEEDFNKGKVVLHVDYNVFK